MQVYINPSCDSDRNIGPDRVGEKDVAFHVAPDVFFKKKIVCVLCSTFPVECLTGLLIKYNFCMAKMKCRCSSVFQCK